LILIPLCTFKATIVALKYYVRPCFTNSFAGVDDFLLEKLNDPNTFKFFTQITSVKMGREKEAANAYDCYRSANKIGKQPRET
jgi:hypothetical protein